MAREIKSECLGGGGAETLSPQEQDRAWWKCRMCGRVLKLRRNESGYAAQVAAIPRHARPKTP